jgi:hypothetical protein
MSVSNALFSFGIAKVDIFSLPPNFFSKNLHYFKTFLHFVQNEQVFAYICVSIRILIVLMR